MTVISHLDFSDMRLFLNVWETSSITKGAERSNISTAAASKRIKNFEAKLGVNIFLRTPSGVTPTSAGEAYLHHANLIVRQLQHLSSELEQYVTGTEGHIRMQANSTAITEFLTTALPKFLSAYPMVHIDLAERMSIDIPLSIVSGLADIGIMAGAPVHKDLEIIPYKEDRLVVVAPVGHRLTRSKTTTFEKILEFDQISLPSASALSQFLRREAEKKGKSIKIRIEVTNCDAVCRMVEANAGLAVIPESAAIRHVRKSTIKILRLSDPWATRKLYIIYRKKSAKQTYVDKLLPYLLSEPHANH
jgi:DNA-binding transcriptional LysR family regulator